MSRTTRIWLILAAALALLGCSLFCGAMTMLNWDFTKLETMQYETKHHPLEEAIVDIQIATKTSNVTFRPSGDNEISVVCHEHSSAKHTVSVKDGVLEIRMVDERKWYDYIGISFGSPRITVSIPEGQYGALSVHGNTGKVNIPAGFGFASMDVSLSTGDVTCGASVTGEMKIETDTGDISLQRLTANTVDLSVSTGALILDHVVVTQTLRAETDTGRIKLDRCDAGELKLETDTGSVTGSLLTPKIFFAQTDTGRVDVPKTTTGGRCEITTDTGDIRITVTE